MSEIGESGDSFILALFKKLANTMEIASRSGKQTDAAQKEVLRQIKQASTNGDPIKGQGVTKSGGDD